MIHKVGRKKNKWTPEMDHEMQTALAAGVSKADIADKLGLTIAAIEARYYKLKRIEKDKRK